MIDSKVFYERMAVCQTCPYWRGVCLKGHALSSPLGCPEHRFGPVEGAGYLENRPAANADPAVPTPCCGSQAQEIKELTYAEAAAHFVDDLKTWKEAGFPLVSAEDYEARLATCKQCPGDFYRWFQCRACKCLVFSKAKLRTTTCPGGYWPVVKA